MSSTRNRIFRTDECRRMITIVCLIIAAVFPLPSMADQKSDFASPPLKFRSRPLWFWNNTALTAAEVEAQMQGNRDKSGYGGMAFPAEAAAPIWATASRASRTNIPMPP